MKKRIASDQLGLFEVNENSKQKNNVKGKENSLNSKIKNNQTFKSSNIQKTPITKLQTSNKIQHSNNKQSIHENTNNQIIKHSNLETERGGTSKLGDLMAKYQKPIELNKHISREFQDFGYRLACEMGEENKKSMYIKLAKTVDRRILEKARSFVIDAPMIDNRGKLFMWAVGKLRKGEKLGFTEKGQNDGI